MNGPYHITKVKKESPLLSKRLENWWGWNRPFYKNRFNFKRVKFQVIRDRNTAMEYLLKGKIDYENMNFPEFWHDKTKTKEFANGYIHRLWFYTDRPRSDYLLTLNKNYEIFKDKRVREALHHSMNVNKLINKVLQGDYERQQAVSRGYGEFTNPNIKVREFDLKKADALLDAAGWSKRGSDGIRVKDGRRFAAKLTYRSPTTHHVLLYSEKAKKAGFDIKLHLMDASAGWKFLRDKKSEIAFVSWATFFRPQYYGLYHSDNANKSNNNNFANVAEPALDKLIDQFRKSTDGKLRRQLAWKIQQWIHDDAIQIPLFEVPYFRIAYWPYIKFPEVQGTRYGQYFQYFGDSSGGLMWYDKDEKKKLKKAMKKNQKLAPVTIVNKTYKNKS